MTTFNNENISRESTFKHQYQSNLYRLHTLHIYNLCFPDIEDCCGEKKPKYIFECKDNKFEQTVFDRMDCISGAKCGPDKPDCPKTKPQSMSACDAKKGPTICEYGKNI